MPSQFELIDLNLPKNSVYHKVLERCPDIGRFRFQDGEYLIREGEMSNEIFLMLLGECAVEQPQEGVCGDAPHTLAVVAAHDPSAPAFLGEMAYLGGGFRSASVRSKGYTYALCLKPEHLGVLIEEFPVLTRILCRQFSVRLRKTSEALKEYHALFSMRTTPVVKQPGELVFSKGEPAETLFRLLDGTLAREVEGAWETVPASGLFLGFVDPLPFFAETEYGLTVKAETEAKLVAIGRDSRLALMRQAPELVLRSLRKP